MEAAVRATERDNEGPPWALSAHPNLNRRSAAHAARRKSDAIASNPLEDQRAVGAAESEVVLDGVFDLQSRASLAQ
jgi:hypothetical protein